MKYEKTKIGIGSFSLLLFSLGFLFSFSFGDQAALGDSIIQSIGLKPWSKGDHGLHYTAFYSLIFFLPALFLGYKYRDDWGAKVGRILSIIFFMTILISSLLVIDI
ncbi:hypothetical protein NC661_16475 [Aquibacillus koreensis]|uniref:Uncharacterized protein n=1 Tax=Aquibacillus koreensis TaxID=279446 RepID=A0A9X3WLN1_9BACI|nr:hypothetical protein [Aquibacillus koreensis]MCT2536898.1 hypothetical protein [Aquibacillus koreensis]MDC3421970.1 hypothetical protein [Aquibacillus koreensis]